MKLARAATILDGMDRGQLSASTDALGVLVAAGLVVDLDPLVLGALERLAVLGDRYGGVAYLEPATRWSDGWIVTALEGLEDKLHSDFHRLVTSDETLAQEEEDRVGLRSLLGSLRDPELLHELQQTAHLLATVVAPGAHRLRTPDAPWSTFSITRFGRELVAVLRIRGADGEQELAPFLAAFRKADAAMNQLAGALHYLNQSVQGVRKGKHFVVAGLAKSGLPPAQAVAAYTQARGRLRTIGLSVEQPHLAVNHVRQIGAGGSMRSAYDRFEAAQSALSRAGFALTPESRGATKFMLAFPDLNAAAKRLRELHHQASGLDASTKMRVAARLLSAEGTPQQASARWQAAGSALKQAGLTGQRDLALAAAAIASMTSSNEEMRAVVGKCAQIARLAPPNGLGQAHEAWNVAINLAAFPGNAEEAVATTLQLASRISGGARPSSEVVELACSFAKRFAIRNPRPPQPSATLPS